MPNYMKTLIVYCSDEGTAEKCANQLKGKLQDKADVIDLKKTGTPEITGYDIVVVGGSIHVGSVQKQLQEFVKIKEKELLSKNIALFLCCGQQESIEQYFEAAFPKDILNHAFARINMGYAYNFDRLGFLKKLIIKKIAKVDKSIDNIKYENIDQLAYTINNIK
ncbi:MAG: hypothetical protein GYA02_07220 [Clostridiaceae bacterium]|nr:hypothetical protein [Clostridiaceae bacterium]